MGENVEFTHNWTIKNFTSYLKKDVLKSTWTVLDGGLTWTLILYPHGNSSTENYVSLFLRSCNQMDIEVNVTLTLIHSDGSETCKKVKNGRTSSQELGFAEFVERASFESSNYYLPGNTITIFCKIIGKSDVLNLFARMSLVEVPDCRLPSHLNSFLESEKFSDVTLSVDGFNFYAHKLILSARSPVFQAMFDHDMTESQSNRVVISDVKQEVVREMLRFIYTGTVGNINDMAGELLDAAEKYNLQRLKSMCEQILCRDLSVDNAVETLILADLLLASTLKAQTFSFIIKNAKDLVDTSSFKSLQITHPHLLLEAFRACTIP